MINLNNKVMSIFADECIYKESSIYSCFNGYNVPSFIKDWLLKRYTTNDRTPDIIKIKKFLNNHIPSKDDDIKKRLMQNEQVKVLVRVLIEPDLKTNIFRFAIPDLGIRLSDGRVSTYLMSKGDIKCGENWGIVILEYVPPYEKEHGYTEMVSFQSFKPYKPEYDYFCRARNEFSIEEWIDFLLTCMEYNPNSEQFNTIEKKITFLSRLLVFVEPNLNMIELAPKGTGKSYVFNNISKYGWHISGGKVTRAKLFYDMNTQTPGLLASYDFVAMDEIKTIEFDNPAEILGGLKNYLESGIYTVGKTRQTSACGMILLGNIDLNEQGYPLNRIYFNELPKFFHDTALLVRFHGFIEGWKLPTMQEDLIFNGYTLNIEYFSEILTMRRIKPEYGEIVKKFLVVPNDADTRDKKAIIKLATGYLKLLFPHVRSEYDISPSDFYAYCFLPAYEKRKLVKQQLSYMDPQYEKSALMPDIKVKGFND